MKVRSLPTVPAPQMVRLHLGKNALVGFMTWEGYNYEDAVLLNERLVRDDVYTSIHIEEYSHEARDTKPRSGGDHPRSRTSAKTRSRILTQTALSRSEQRFAQATFSSVRSPKGRDRAYRRGKTSPRDLRREVERRARYFAPRSSRRKTE